MKRKSEFPKLEGYNPFAEENIKTMACREWRDFETLRKWRLNYLKEMLCPTNAYDLMDIDDISKQWNVERAIRKASPKTCMVIWKPLALYIRRLEAEDYYAKTNNNLPGVIKSSYTSKYLYTHFNIAEDGNCKAVTKIFDSEEEAFVSYKLNRSGILKIMTQEALDNKLLSKADYDIILENVRIKEYEYYKENNNE